MADWGVAIIGVVCLVAFLWAQRRWQARQVAVSRIPTLQDRTVLGPPPQSKEGPFTKTTGRKIMKLLDRATFDYYRQLTNINHFRQANSNDKSPPKRRPFA